MDDQRPKPRPPVKKVVDKPIDKPHVTTPIPVGEVVNETPKKPFVLKPHLTERPLKHHEGLEELKNTMKGMQ